MKKSLAGLHWLENDFMDSLGIEEIRALEEKAISSGTTALELMERAGAVCANLIESESGPGKNILIFCGPGNNGGDGFVCAFYLSKNNSVKLVIPDKPKTDAAKQNLARARAEKIPALSLEEAKAETPQIIVDALLGIGATLPLRGKIKDACILFNSIPAYKVSIDVPTGMDAETGESAGDAVKPDATICIQAPKIGELKAGKEKTGKMLIAEIGLK